jgi:hypothetical protein
MYKVFPLLRVSVSEAREAHQKAVLREDESNGMAAFKAGGGNPVKAKGAVKGRWERFFKTGFAR